MSNHFYIELDGRRVEASAGDTLWRIAKREGIEIEHLCFKDQPGYRADGNCRACLVEIDGERTLAASCKREATPDMVVRTASERATLARRGVIELLLSDHPANADASTSLLKRWADKLGITQSRFAQSNASPATDASHPAIVFSPDACITCGLCVRACREVQVNDVIGLSGRGAHSRIVFDANLPMGDSSCVACGECVQACPTDALRPAHASSAPMADDQTVESLCPYCGVGCRVSYTVRDGRIINAEGADGAANQYRLCVKGRFGFDYTHHPDRLTQPLIRKEGADKDPANIPPPSQRREAFREATWEEALEMAARGLADARAQFGSHALAGFGSAKGSNEEAYLFQKLVRTGFGTNNVDHCTRLCHASSVAALMEGLGSAAVSAPFTAAAKADVIIVIGARPEQNHPVAASYIKNAVKAGAQLIVMDPRGQALGRHATHMLQFTSGMDTALLNALIHTIIEEDLCDHDFIARRVDGFNELKENSKAFSPEKMAPLCGIDAKTLREVARLYARSDRAIIFWGMGISQHVHGTDNARALISLALITGHVGRDGTGLHPLRGQNNVQGASDVGLIPMVYPDYQPITNDEAHARFEQYWGTPLDRTPGLTVVEIINAARQRDIRAMYIMGENPAMSDPDTTHARAGLAALDHLVVQDIFLTETAWLADVILPASTLFEKTGTFTNTNRQVQLAHKVIDTPGNARGDLWIVQEIATRLGLDWHYGGAQDVYAEMRNVMPSIKGISWQRLRAEHSVTYPCDDEALPGRAILFNPKFPTQNGKGRVVPVDVGPPDEMPDDDYPLVLTTGRMLEHWHTGAMTRHATTLNTLEPEAVVSLHPRLLEKLSVRPGEHVRVASRRGTVELATRADTHVPETMAFIPFCFFEAAANLLTNPKLDPFGKIPEFKACAIRIEKL